MTMKISHSFAKKIQIVTQKTVELFVESLKDKEFVLRKWRYDYHGGTQFKRIMETVGDRLKEKVPGSKFGFFVEFSRLYDDEHEVRLTVFEILPPEFDVLSSVKDWLKKEKKYSEDVLSRDNLFIEILPIFPTVYEINDVILLHNLEEFFYSPFRVLY